MEAALLDYKDYFVLICYNKSENTTIPVHMHKVIQEIYFQESAIDTLQYA